MRATLLCALALLAIDLGVFPAAQLGLLAAIAFPGRSAAAQARHAAQWHAQRIVQRVHHAPVGLPAAGCAVGAEK